MTPQHMDSAPPTHREVLTTSDGFVSESSVREWQRRGASVSNGVLICRDGRRFLLADALRVLGPQCSDVDPYGLTGRVSTLRELLRQGAALQADLLRLGSATYDVEYGYLARQMGSADESGAYPRA